MEQKMYSFFHAGHDGGWVVSFDAGGSVAVRHFGLADSSLPGIETRLRRMAAAEASGPSFESGHQQWIEIS